MTGTMDLQKVSPLKEKTINRVKKIQVKRASLEEFKLLSVKVKRHIKGENLKELHVLKLFLIKAEVAGCEGKLKGLYGKLTQRKNEAQKRLILLSESDCDNLLTKVESLPESITNTFFQYLAVVGLVIGVIGGIFFPPLCLFLVAPLGYSFNTLEKSLWWKKIIKSISI